jgi:hypothetical protein
VSTIDELEVPVVIEALEDNSPSESDLLVKFDMIK